MRVRGGSVRRSLKGAGDAGLPPAAVRREKSWPLYPAARIFPVPARPAGTTGGAGDLLGDAQPS